MPDHSLSEHRLVHFSRLFFSGLLFVAVFFNFGVQPAMAAPVKVLSNSRHAYGTIQQTIDQLLGRAHNPITEFIIHSTASASGSCGSDSTYSGATPLYAISTTSIYVYCDENGATTTAQLPYQIFSTSFTGNPGDSVTTYNQFATYDLTDDYAFTNSSPPTLKTPPTLYTAPGGGGWASAAGVEWTIDPVVFCSGTLSCLTAANTGIMAWLRFNHSTWNWFDVKAAMRQNGTNWATGYSNTTYGFGVVNATTTNTLTDGQILLQPPEVATSTSGIYGQITFTVYPFRQTRRVKEVLFQFATNPGFQANELTLAQIQALGGTKVTEYTGTTATTTTPFYTAVTNAYFVWFTADNATDAAANFSRIDTYTILGPLSQSEVPFNSTFDLASPTNNVSATPSPTFSWNAASSYLGISKYQLFIDGSLDTDNITDTSAVSTATLSAGAHTWYVKTFNGGGTATSSVSTRTINVLPGYAPGYTFYVDNVLGNDNNPGTQTQPWATLAKAGSTAQAGDTVVIIKNAGQPYREKLTLSRAGTSGSRITFRGVDANSKPEIWGSDDVSGGWSSYGGGNPDTYQKTLAKQTWIVATGPSIGNLTKRVNGSSKTSLNPGEWVSDSSDPYVLYYRLASGEDISTLHIEADTRDYGISGTTYTTLKNIIVRYANTAGVDLFGTGSVVQGVEVYDSYAGIIAELNAQPTINYCVSAGNDQFGIGGAYGNPKIYNSLMYGNGASGSNIDIQYIGNSATLKNNISSGNSVASFSFNAFWGPATITASNNAWDIAGDSHWDNFKGTNNQELKDSLFVSTSTRNFTLQQFSPNIDTGIAISGLTTDILGNPIYGTPDIGPYEYQPPYSVVSGSVPVSGSFRIYKNGKYRMTAATSSSATANMTITPSGGFPSGDYSEWLNISIDTWNTSGDYAKSWTASSSAATAVAATIGNLASSSWYTISVDGTPSMTLESDASGSLSYTYAGTLSTMRTFSVSQAAGAPLSLSAPADNTTSASAPSLGWSWSSGAGSDLVKYQLYVDGALATDSIAPSSTSVAAPSSATCNVSHSWYVRAVDGGGNGANSDTRHFTVFCGSISTIAPSVPAPPPSLPSSAASTSRASGGLTSVQIKSILALLSSFGADSSTIAKVTLALAGTPSTNTNPIVPSCSFTRDLAVGKEGKDVTCLQQGLVAKGYVIPDGTTGYFGGQTRAALGAWQKATGISPDRGYFGPLSRGRWGGG